MARKVAARAEVAPFHVMEVVRAAREREEATGDVLHLEVGQPSTGAPEAALDAARAALDRPDGLGYTDADGLPALRRAIADRYTATGTAVDPAQVAVTTGASAGCVLAFLAAFQPGDRVAVCEPGYPCYRQMLTALGVEPVPIRIRPETRFQPTAALLDAALPLDGVVVASPSNPTGSVLTPNELAALVDWCEVRDVRLVADEIYHGITFGPPAPTAAAHPAARPIVVNSFSKYFSMTGWRLGWLVLPAELVRPVELLAQNLFISPPTLSQVAAIAAFDATTELDGHVVRYQANRDIVLDGLARLGCTTVAPAEGAFYCYADVSHLGGDSQELSRRWLDELGVATTPGIDFDPVEGGRYIRLSFAGPTADVTEAMVRLAGWASR
jgi:aspartate/methionine/tyrosine aminotransferase